MTTTLSLVKKIREQESSVRSKVEVKRAHTHRETERLLYPRFTPTRASGNGLSCLSKVADLSLTLVG